MPYTYLQLRLSRHTLVASLHAVAPSDANLLGQQRWQTERSLIMTPVLGPSGFLSVDGLRFWRQ
jgi:hypothetical protein